MDDNLKYFFASFQIPSNTDDFILKQGYPESKISVRIYVPGEKSFASFFINNSIFLTDFKANSNQNKLSLKINDYAKSISRVSHLGGAYKDFMTQLGGVYKDFTAEDSSNKYISNPFKSIFKRRMEEVSFFDFITQCENSFYQLMSNGLTHDYYLKEGLEGHQIKPIFETNYLNKFKDNFSSHFLTIKNYLLDMENPNLKPSYSIVGKREDLNTVLKDAELLKVRHDLQHNLHTNSTMKKTAKI